MTAKVEWQQPWPRCWVLDIGHLRCVVDSAKRITWEVGLCGCGVADFRGPALASDACESVDTAQTAAIRAATGLLCEALASIGAGRLPSPWSVTHRDGEALVNIHHPQLGPKSVKCVTPETAVEIGRALIAAGVAARGGR